MNEFHFFVFSAFATTVMLCTVGLGYGCCLNVNYYALLL